VTKSSLFTKTQVIHLHQLVPLQNKVMSTTQPNKSSVFLFLKMEKMKND